MKKAHIAFIVILAISVSVTIPLIYAETLADFQGFCDSKGHLTGNSAHFICNEFNLDKMSGKTIENANDIQSQNKQILENYNQITTIDKAVQNNTSILLQQATDISNLQSNGVGASSVTDTVVSLSLNSADFSCGGDTTTLKLGSGETSTSPYIIHELMDPYTHIFNQQNSDIPHIYALEIINGEYPQVEFFITNVNVSNDKVTANGWITDITGTAFCPDYVYSSLITITTQCNTQTGPIIFDDKFNPDFFSNIVGNVGCT
jgi:hypothetical protein